MLKLVGAEDWKTFWPLVLCLICLPVLAWKQYEWLGRLSEDEGERLQQALQHDLEQAERRVGTELMGRFQMPDLMGVAEAENRGRLLRGLPVGLLVLEVWDEAKCWRWVEKRWVETPAGVCDADEGMGPQATIEFKDKQVVVVRAMRMREEGMRRGVRIVLDQGVFFTQRVTPILREELGEEYRVEISDRKTKSVVYASDGDLTPIAEPDAVTVLLPMFGGRGGPFGFGKGRPPMRVGEPPMKMGPPLPGDRRGREASYEMRAVHKAGNLQAKVQRSRIGNLALSAGVMVLLMASLVGMYAVTRRTRELARRQMEFVAGVSHELRTPLAVIYSAGQNLADGVTMDGDKVKRYGRVIADEGKRLREMVEEILGYARATRTESVKSDWEIRDLGGIVEEAIGSTAGEVERSGCLLEKTIEPNLLVEGERAALEHAVRNLILNATKYARDGAWIGVRCEERKGRAVVEVADRGPGLGAKEKQRIFEPFFRGDAAENSRAHGLGLGLALVKRIAEMHGGSVELETEEGAGARFRILLPIAKMEA